MSASNILVIPLKRTEHVELSSVIKAYIERGYDQHPDMFQTDITALESLRESILNLEVRNSSLNSLIKYFVQLTFLSSKLPTDIKAGFIWYSSIGYATTAGVIHSDLQFERANVLFNIGALYSKLGVEENRTTGEGLKRASQYFQLAAGTFEFLKTNLIPELHVNPPDDMAVSTLDVLKNLMLAQAQECFWQKAILDNMKNSIIARLAHQVSLYYGQTLDCTLKSAVIKSEWIHHITCKKFHFEAAAQFRISTDCLSTGKYGEEIARLRAALELCNQALSSSKYVSNAVSDDLKGLKSRLQSDIARADKDNDLIYLAMVPSIASLALIKPASTVETQIPPDVGKPIDALASGKYGPALFANLVPFAAHLAISIYEDRRDSIVNKLIIPKLDVLTIQVHEILTYLGLPGALQALERPVGIPPSLLTHIEEIRATGGVEVMRSTIDDVRRLASSHGSIYLEAAGILEQEREEDDELRMRHGTDRWKRPTSKEVGAQLYANLQSYSNIIKSATESDEIVRAKFRDNERTFDLISQDLTVVERYLPSSEVSQLDPALQLHAVQVRERLNEISKVEYRRKLFVEELLHKAKEDDVTDTVLKETARLERLDPLTKIEAAQFEAIFTERLKKYDDDKDRVEHEEEEQTKLVTELELANLDFKNSLATCRGSKQSEREAALQQLEAGYFKFLEIKNNLEEGRKFYNDFARSLLQFQQECNDFVYSRRVEAQELETDLALQFDRLKLEEMRTDSPLPAPRAQGPPPPVLNNATWNPSHGIQFAGKR
ncbi:BRO1-like domain-containing protein [Lipomyces japonicus]|uniref:BRO1-like domain-containing protein n=1 Tax=Lipomyces japonicus TaxID=56871 RepID=UPI0034CF5AB6